MLLTFVEGFGNYLSCSAALFFFFGEVFDSNIMEEFGESFDGIVLGLPIVSFVLSAVKGRIVGGGMISHPISHKLQKVKFLMLQNVFSSMLSGWKDCEGVIAVNSRRCNPEGNCSWNNTIRDILVLSWGWNSVFIISKQEKSLASKSSCEVQCSWEISLTSCSLSKIASNYLTFSCSSEGISRSSCLRNLCGYMTKSLLRGDDTVTLFNSLLP